ncbi:hypothetical protein B5K06_19195 [Rhizobium grahamii]|uniref:Uncharacterized protein n=1 Tax=Rhizobium grahamii TaxID=1120045 RepID=A0A370KKS0_9HYPH|nr:hypothetical protein B5K06_19195 [Rhizobium grahamii]
MGNFDFPFARHAVLPMRWMGCVNAASGSSPSGIKRSRDDPSQVVMDQKFGARLFVGLDAELLPKMVSCVSSRGAVGASPGLANLRIAIHSVQACHTIQDAISLVDNQDLVHAAREVCCLSVCNQRPRQ